MVPLITIDIFSMIPLFFTISLAQRHVLQNKKNIYYITAATITIVLLVLEILSYTIANMSGDTAVVLNQIVNMLGFSLSPAVPYVVLLFNSRNAQEMKRRDFLALPLLFNVLLCVMSTQTGWIFTISAQNVYTRGVLFLLPTAVSMFYYALIFKGTYENRDAYENGDKWFLMGIFLLPILATVLQIQYPQLLLIWSSVSITLLLYYVFSLELQFSFDIQTGTKNRSAYEREIQQLNSKNRDATIFVFDINNLKKINDILGHKMGDSMISSAVDTIKTCFGDVGETYRIGGDEFCVVAKQMPDHLALMLLNRLEKKLAEINQFRPDKIELAFGYSTSDIKSGRSLYFAFSDADNAMYVHKAKLKGVFGRRKNDNG